MNEWPNDIIYHIFIILYNRNDAKSLVNCKLVCVDWYNVINNNPKLLNNMPGYACQLLMNSTKRNIFIKNTCRFLIKGFDIRSTMADMKLITPEWLNNIIPSHLNNFTFVCTDMGTANKILERTAKWLWKYCYINEYQLQKFKNIDDIIEIGKFNNSIFWICVEKYVDRFYGYIFKWFPIPETSENFMKLLNNYWYLNNDGYQKITIVMNKIKIICQMLMYLNSITLNQ